MFNPVGGDRFAVNVVFSRNGAVVAQGVSASTTAVATYTPFTVPLNYASPEVPDTAIIQIQIVGPGTGADFHVGSVMHVDSLAFVAAVTPAPSLSIRRQGDSVVISWPADVTGFALQATQGLNPVDWSNVPGVVNNTYQTTPSAARYFRLYQQ